MPSSLSPSLAIEALSTTESLEGLQPEWTALWRRCPDATPFQSPAWLVPWWRHLGEGQLTTLALRHEGRLVGVAPLYVYTEPDSMERKVFFLGVGTTDYLGVLLENAFIERGTEAIFAWLSGARDRWDVCELGGLRESSPLRSAPVPQGWTDDLAEHEACPVVSLPASADALSSVASSGLLKNLRYVRRKAEKLGSVQIERATADTLESLVDALLRLHGARWAERGLPGVLAEREVQAMHREAVHRLLSLGSLRIYALRLEGDVIAVFYGLADRNGKRLYYYLGGFDPEHGDLSPGLLLIEHAMRDAIREGFTAFDFLRGQETYKYRWGAEDRPTYRRRLWHVSGGGMS